jgi:hypothetical protein
MDYKYLTPITFSDGIRDEEIQHNLDTIMQHISRERLYTAGYGVAHGLEFNVNQNFSITITEGTLIDENGSEIYFPESTLSVTAPRLTYKEETLQVTAKGEIFLSYIPYSTQKAETVQSAFVRENAKGVLRPVDILSKLGLQICDYNNESKILDSLNIIGTRVFVDKKYKDSLVKAKYRYSGRRYDVIYVDENDEMKIYEGLTSSSPSVSLPSKKYDPEKSDIENKNSYKMVIGFIEINAYYGFNRYLGIGTIVTKHDLRNIRNIYTDEDNKLFICGVPFDSIQLINMEPPTDMKENMLWYDESTNKLKIYKNNNGILEWATVNDSSYIPSYSLKMWTPDDNPADLQTFLFDENSLDLKFCPGYNSLEIIIDQTPLHSDQFSEITIEDEDGEYVNTGIGFKLAYPLEKPSYVEVRVRQIVNKNPLPNRFQRSATFVDEGFEVYQSSKADYIFATSAPYRYGENQLEVFIDGRRLINKLDFIEGPELEESKKVKGTITNEFCLLNSVANNAVISYRISNTVYSFDHIYKFVEDLAQKIEDSENTVANSISTINQFMSDVGLQVSGLNDAVVAVQDTVSDINSSYIRNDDRLSEENMPISILFPKGLISESFIKAAGVDSINVTGLISPEDFVNVFNIGQDGSNKVMKQGAEFTIERNLSNGQIMFNISSGAVSDGSTIYVNGIKFK